jgi:hypothetical protein
MSEENSDLQEIKTKDEQAEKAALVRAFKSGFWNSGLLAFWFATMIPSAVSSGNYFMTALGAFCIYLTIRDTLIFYSYWKENTDGQN